MPPDAAPRFPPPGFRRFWVGESISGLGTYVTLLALQVLVVVDLGGGPVQTGWLSAARWLPYLVVGLLVGALVDRVRRRPVMITSEVVRVVLLGAIPLAWAVDVLTLTLLLLIVLAYGAASLVNDAASQSFLPRLVPRAQLQLAHARIDGADAVAQTAGPALGGVLARTIGAPLTVLAAAVGHAASAIAVATLTLPEPARDRARPRGVRTLLGEIADGVRWVYRGSGLARLAVATHIWFAANAVIGVVMAPYALTELGLSEATFGLVVGAAGLGALGGAVLSTRIGAALGTIGAIITAHTTTVLGVLTMAAAVLVADTSAAAFVLGAGQVLHGFAMGLSNSHEMTFRQALTPDAMQSRTNTTMRAANRAVLVVVSPLAGLLAAGAGMAVALLVSAAVFALAAGVLLRVRHARIDDGDDPDG